MAAVLQNQYSAVKQWNRVNAKVAHFHSFAVGSLLLAVVNPTREEVRAVLGGGGGEGVLNKIVSSDTVNL